MDKVNFFYVILEKKLHQTMIITSNAIILMKFISYKKLKRIDKILQHFYILTR